MSLPLSHRCDPSNGPITTSTTRFPALFWQPGVSPFGYPMMTETPRCSPAEWRVRAWSSLDSATAARTPSGRFPNPSHERPASGFEQRASNPPLHAPPRPSCRRWCRIVERGSHSCRSKVVVLMRTASASLVVDVRPIVQVLPRTLRHKACRRHDRSPQR